MKHVPKEYWEQLKAGFAADNGGYDADKHGMHFLEWVMYRLYQLESKDATES
jgi:hypothetical protein